MNTTPIKVNLAELDTHPLLVWPMMKLIDGVLSPQDMTPAARDAELYYWEDNFVGNVKKALWKVTLEKIGGEKVRFTPSPTEPYYPDEFLLRGRGTRIFVGWLRYHDTGSTPPTHKWIKNALEVTAEDAPVDPD